MTEYISMHVCARRAHPATCFVANPRRFAYAFPRRAYCCRDEWSKHSVRLEPTTGISRGQDSINTKNLHRERHSTFPRRAPQCFPASTAVPRAASGVRDVLYCCYYYRCSAAAALLLFVQLLCCSAVAAAAHAVRPKK